MARPSVFVVGGDLGNWPVRLGGGGGGVFLGHGAVRPQCVFWSVFEPGWAQFVHRVNLIHDLKCIIVDGLVVRLGFGVRPVRGPLLT